MMRSCEKGGEWSAEVIGENGSARKMGRLKNNEN